MNIAIVTTWFPAGGGYVSKAYKEILEKEHKIFIYARGGQVMKGNPDWDLPNVTWAPRHYNGIKTSHFIKWLKQNKIDTIFFNEQRYWKPVLEAKKAGFCIGAYIDYYTQSTVPAFEIYDFLICNTKRHYSVFDWHKNVHYIPWGTDIEKFKPNDLCINESPVFIVNAGWQPKYNGDRRGSLLALQAFQNVIGECRLDFYSQVPFVESLTKWQKLLKSDDRINFIFGTIDPFPYNKGDIYLYPSRLDGIGLTLPEAISSGLAAITSNNAPMNEFVENNYNGFLIDVEKYLGRPDSYYWAESICDISSLIKAMQTYVDNPVLIQQHKKNARNFAINKLNWSKNAINLSEIFKRTKNHNIKKVNSELIKLLNNLDKVMAPTDWYKLISAFSISYKHVINKK